MNSDRLHLMSEVGGNVIFISGSETQRRLADLLRLLAGEVAK